MMIKMEIGSLSFWIDYLFFMPVFKLTLNQFIGKISFKY